MASVAPHPGDLVDLKELGQLETEHGGPHLHVDLETEGWGRKSGICPRPQTP